MLTFYPRYAQHKIHEPEATALFQELSRKEDAVADVGCNLGWFTCIASKSNPHCRVFAFEMDPDNYKICLRNLKLNSCSNVILENLAVADTDDRVHYFKDVDVQPSAGHSLGGRGSIIQSVGAVCLDTYFSDKQIPAVIKIDVEGAELKVLKGMQDILNSPTCHSILIEIHPHLLEKMGDTTTEVVELLEAAGFKLWPLNHREGNGPLDILSLNFADGAGMLLAKKE